MLEKSFLLQGSSHERLKVVEPLGNVLSLSLSVCLSVCLSVLQNCMLTVTSPAFSCDTANFTVKVAGIHLLPVLRDNFCIVLFSGVHKLTALYNILQHFLSFTNTIHIIITTNNV